MDQNNLIYKKSDNLFLCSFVSEWYVANKRLYAVKCHYPLKIIEIIGISQLILIG